MDALQKLKKPMKSFGILLFACFVGKSFGSYDHDRAMFENWKITYNKTYADEFEEEKRYNQWMKNLNLVQSHNVEYALNKQLFRVEMNHLADMSSDEVNFQLTGHITDKYWKKIPGSTYLKLNNVNDDNLPRNVDWRKEGLVTSVKTQGHCGACYAFSALGSLEGQRKRKTGILESLSVQNVLDCSANWKNHGCHGGMVDKTFRYIISQGGIESEATYPYEHDVGKCRYNAKDSVVKQTGYVDIVPRNETVLKEAVATIGPISIAIDARHSMFHLYAYGIYYNPHCRRNKLTHAVLIVGYGVSDINNEEYWLVKNSWGKDWGENGYVKIARNKNNMCGISTRPSYPLL